MAGTKMQLADWLDDLCVRFIVNLPQEELESVERICFQVEEAQWFYEDFVRPLDPSLPSMSLRTFCMAIFRICPLLSSFSPEHHLAAYSQFLAYKTRVPVRGAILLNETMDHVLLVKGWKKGASWSFPRGKINKDERDLDCATREVFEETGYALASAGLVPSEDSIKSIEVTMREQHMKLYVFRNVSMDTSFQARTRKEISKIAWWRLSSLPGYQKRKKQNTSGINDEEDSAGSLKANKLYMVAPFLPQLRKWIGQQRRQDSHKRTASETCLSTGDAQITDGDVIAEDDMLSDMPAHSVAPMAYDFSTALPQMVSNSSAGSVTHAASSDAAAQMKRMLGVFDHVDINSDRGNASGSLAQQQQKLLGMLRQDGQPNAQTAHSAFPPVTPLQQVETNASEPESPRHSHLRLPLVSNMAPPPRFPFQPSQLQAHQLASENSRLPHIQASHMHQDNTLREAFQPYSVQIQPSVGSAALPIPSRSTVTDNRNLTLTNTKSKNYAQSADAGGSSVFPPLQSLNQQTPVAPPASQLPKPKLSDHAMNLLNMFKANPTEGSDPPKLGMYTAPTKSEEAPAAPQSNVSDVANNSSVQSAPSKNTTRASRSAFAGLIPSSVSHSSKDGQAKPPLPVQRSTKPNSNQDALLGILTNKSSATARTSSIPPTGPKSLDSTPRRHLEGHSKEQLSIPVKRDSIQEQQTAPQPQVGDPSGQALSDRMGKPKLLENPAKSGTRDVPPAETKSTVRHQVSTNSQPAQVKPPKSTKKEPSVPPQKATPTILRRPPQTSTLGPTDREEVHGPAKQSDVERTPRRRNKAPKTALQKAEKKLGAHITPTQILKRPSTLNPEPHQDAQGEKPSSSALKTTNAGEASNKPFTPQILRRPKADRNSSSTATPTTGDKGDGRPRDNEEHQRTLLSLLGGSGTGLPPSSSATARKYSGGQVQDNPTSPTPQSPSVKMELSRSHINSIASPPGGEVSQRSRMNSATSIQRAETPLRSGRDSASSQTPISPADKGFLVSYLEGVIGKSGGSK